MTAATDAELVRRAKEGDARAFEQIVETYERLLFNLALRMVRDREDARDLTQTVFVKVYRNLGSYDPRHRFFSWIYRIMINESLNLLSRRKRQEPLDEMMMSHEPSPEDCLDGQQVGEAVQGALMELPTGDRQTIVFRHFLELSHAEMSEVLGVPEKTVKSRLFSARRKLADILRRRGVQPS